MKIEYIKGDLLEAPENYILHGVSAKGVMGSGVAKLIREKYPQAYTDYRNRYENVGLKMCDIIISVQLDGKMIVNAISQRTYGTTGVHVSYDALSCIFSKLNNIVQDDSRIAMPMIGAGLAGGDWEIIERIIETNSTRYQPVVYQL